MVPILAAIGRDLDLIKSVGGVEGRVRRIVGAERRQPNGGLFELLVAAAYRRAGGKVTFKPERPGVSKTHDMDVLLAGEEIAVECKRMETGAYGERERTRMRELWSPAFSIAVDFQQSIFGSVDFFVPIVDVPPTYLADLMQRYVSSGMPSLLWEDRISRGVLGELDTGPLGKVLETDDVMVASTRLQELLTGRYIRHANYLQATKHRQGMSPRHMTECEWAILLRWQSTAQSSTDAKARDVLQKLAEANAQLPADKPGIVHIGFEAVEGDEVEKARYDKILASTASFDPRGKPLQYVFCHYLVPESPPDQAWAFDETVQWRIMPGVVGRPPHIPFLVVPESDAFRHGPHWQI